MAIIATTITEVGTNRIEGQFTTDGVALPNTTGTIAAPAAPTANVLITVPAVTALTVGDVVKIDGIGPAGVPVIAGIGTIPDAVTINVQGTRVSTAIAGQPITVLPFLFIKHNIKRVTMTNLTTADSFEWSDLMVHGSRIRKTAAGAQDYSATDGFYVRGACVYLHPAMYAINSTYVFSMDY